MARATTSRQGRQPASQPKPATGARPKSKGKASKAKAPALTTPGLDIYSYSSSVKKGRGDIDPESRLQPQRAGKGKGKERDEEGSDEDSEGDYFKGEGVVEFNGMKPANLYMGGDGEDDDTKINSEDDEDIDSDDAFEDEDDLPLKPKKGKAGKIVQRAPEIDMDEEEEDPDDEEGGNYMDASEMLDTGEFDSEVDSSEAESGSGSEEEDDDEVDEDEEMDSEVDSEYEGALDKLSSFVDGLESKKRRMDDDDESGKKKKRIVLKERTEAYPEGEFVAVSAPEGVNDSKVNLEDLLASFANSKNPRLAALRKTLKPLAASTSASSSSSTSHLKASGPLAAPLPARLQDKIEREAAYEKTREETDKWNETVRRMKGHSGLGVTGARHERLTLPLMGPGGDVKRDPNAAEWSAKFQPTNELESSIQALLSAGQMSSSDLQKAEKTALAALDPADVAARQAELRQQRDLMFRAERKAKRVAKIKSKAFRRIHRRAKGKGEEGLSIEDMLELDKLDGGDRVTEEKARMEVARARERATLKHSTKGGRWSKTVGGIEGLDEERNTAVRDMVARGEELRKKIAGVDADDSNDEYAEGDSDEDDANADFDTIRRTAFDELASIDAKDAAAAAAAPKAKGVLGMKFMQDAIAREGRKVEGSANELRRKLERMDEMGQDDDEDEDENSVAMSEQVDGNAGRMVFGPSGTQQPAPSRGPPAAITKTAFSTKLSGPLAIASSSTLSSRSPLSLGTPTADSNPWLAVDESAGSGKISRKMNKATVGKDSRDANRSAAKVDRHRSKQTDAREAEKDDAQVEIDPQVVLARSKAPAAPQIVAPAQRKGTAMSTMDPAGDASSDEDDEEQHNAQRGKGPAAFKQRELVARAFAGDNVVADFEAEKRREIELHAPKELDNTLPGWGTWSGKGVKKAKNPRKFITKIPGLEASERKDANYSNVIISEKKDKKAAKYLLKDLPFPYTSAAQHEHKLRTPLGPEWSTSTILRDQTIPDVLIKPGVTIRPVANRI